MHRRMIAIGSIGFALALSLVVFGWPRPAVRAEEQARYVALAGSDANPGTLEQPWRTITQALRSLQPGQTLYVRGGTYVERVRDFTLPQGASDARIIVQAYPGEQPVVQGLLWLTGADYWTFDGLNVTWDSATGASTEHMVKFTGGTGWVFTNAEIWGARSYAAILVTGAPASYTLSYLNVHDTYAANEQWQDHLIYINSYAGGDGGVIEHNLLWNSDNGRGIKVGPSDRTAPVGNLVIRSNTLYNNLGPANISLSYSASDVRIERNILQKVGERKANIDATSLTGTNNLALDNIGWESAHVVDGDSPGLADGGNLWLDPQLADPALGDFTAHNPAAQGYGR